ncbi:hypothetical protein QLQ12_18400 [Actinoplanes sp. NEAU-A12]|uniref:Uncharacterized protein n=2 Tax=Actinoplanes sandaracinus TaxID=3045177 RepID=A0ABT6WLI2_9ACTN|nr:hypothetical protein [Actinoplanes sandaracinus]MDI6100584.1 hypothetical protein [Actinoplanes sandaracinus]
MFGAETIEPSPADLAGLLAGPGRLDRMGGTARVSVRVDAAWRVHVLVTEMGARGLTATWAPVPEDQDPDGVRAIELSARKEAIVTPEHPTTADEPGPTEPADSPGAAETPSGDDPPAGPPAPLFDVRTAYSRRLNGLARAWPEASAQLFLSGPRMRLWVAAAGGPRPGGYALGLDPGKDRHVVEAALVRAGLAGRVSDDGRRYLITGARRLRRLAELVGERPSAAPEEFWPGGALA